MYTHNKYPGYEAKMLITLKGFMVRLKRPLINHASKISCFFVDKDFNFVPWKLTITKGIKLDLREYNRLKGLVGLEETFLTDKQFDIAVKLGKIVEADPYFGLEQALKDRYQKRDVDTAKASQPVKRKEVAVTAPPVEEVRKPKVLITTKMKKAATQKMKREAQPFIGAVLSSFDQLAQLIAC